MNGQSSLGPVPEPVPALTMLGGTVAKHWTASMLSKCEIVGFFVKQNSAVSDKKLNHSVDRFLLYFDTFCFNKNRNHVRFRVLMPIKMEMAAHFSEYLCRRVRKFWQF